MTILELLLETTQNSLQKENTDRQDLALNLSAYAKEIQEKWFREYSQELTKQQAFWSAFLALILTIVVGTFLILEDTHVRDILNQEAQKIQITLEQFKSVQSEPVKIESQ